MLKGIYLTLMIGPGVPVPVPQTVVEALTSVRVTTTATTQEPSGFELTFTLSHRSPLHTLFLVTGGSALPLVRVILVVTINGRPQVLIDGVMTNHEVVPGPQPGQSTLTVIGDDLTRVMDYLDGSGTPYPGMPPETRVLVILAKYAALGIVPLVIPSLLSDVPLPTNRIPVQCGTDLQYIQQLAAQVGYVFYLEPGPAPGTTVAYWGPEIKVGVPQPALSVNMDAHTNVEALSFSFNSQSRTETVALIQDEFTKVTLPIPVPDISLLKPPLGLIPPLPLKVEFLRHTAKLSPLQAAMAGAAEATRTADTVAGQGSLDVLRYGRVLKARQLVGVRGAGLAFDGLYYVTSVTNAIQRGEFKQQFTLSRNGLLSTVPRVRP
jgi:hypothetical protein